MSNGIDLGALRGALAGSVSGDANVRAAADAHLEAAAAQSGAALGLLQIASDPSVDLPTRQSASIYFKNLTNKSWAQREGSVPTAPAAKRLLDEGEKAAVRRVALEAVANTPSKVRSQLVEAVRVIVYYDFPERWPEVANQVLQNLNEANANECGKLVGTVLVLGALVRKYEFKDESERVNIDTVIDVVFPKLLELLKALVTYQGPPNVELEELKKAICKTYWSATYMHFSPTLRDPAVYREWVSTFHALIIAPISTEGMPTDDKTELKHWPWWKSKKWALRVINRQFDKFSNLKRLSPELKTLATIYRDEFAPQMLNVYAELLNSVTAGAAVPDRIVNLSVSHLTTAVNASFTYKAMEPFLDQMFVNNIFPLVCFTNEDAELWEDDPHEYVRKTQDFIEDMYSPRTAAINYISELTKTGKRMKDNLPKVLAHVVSIFTRFQAVPQGTPLDAKLRAEVDGALVVIENLRSTLQAHPEYKHQLEQMLMAYVYPAFGSTHGHIRAKAVSCAAKFSGIEFTDKENFMRLFYVVVNSMKDPDLPVRVEAVVGLGAFVNETDDVSALKSILPELLDEFFKLMSEVESEDVVYTLETITEKFGEDIAPFALGMTQNLAAAFWKVVNESEAREEEEYGLLASIGCLRAMATILESISGLPHMYPDLEAAVFPILHKMIGEQGYDVFEEVLEILAYLTYFTPQVTPRMWELWPLMIRTMDDWALQYFDNLLIPLDNYISRGTEQFLAPGTPYVEDTYNVCKKVLEGEYPETDCLAAPKLMECVMVNCRGRVDVVIEPYVNIALAKLPTAELPYYKDLLMMTYAHAMHYNPALALAATNKNGTTPQVLATWSQMLNERKKSGERKCFTGERAKKVCALGLIGLLRAPSQMLTPELQGAMGGILNTLSDLLTDLQAQIAKRKEDEASGVRRNPYDFDDDDEDYEELDIEDDDGEDLNFDETTLRALAQRAGAANPFYGGAFGDDDDDEDFWFDDDDETCTSPLDDIDPFISFSELMNEMQSSDRAAVIQSSMAQPEVAGKVTKLMSHAQVRAVEHPLERKKARQESAA